MSQPASQAKGNTNSKAENFNGPVPPTPPAKREEINITVVDNNDNARQPMNNFPRQENNDRKHDSGTHKQPVHLQTVTTTEHGIHQKNDQIISEMAVLDGPIVHKDQTQMQKLVRNDKGKFVPVD